MRRGDVVILGDTAPGGGERPCVVVQGGWTLDVAATVTLCPITTDLLGIGRIRVPVEATADTGLPTDGEVEIDRIATVRRTSITRSIGALPDGTMRRIDRSLKNWLDL